MLFLMVGNFCLVRNPLRPKDLPLGIFCRLCEAVLISKDLRMGEIRHFAA